MHLQIIWLDELCWKFTGFELEWDLSLHNLLIFETEFSIIENNCNLVYIKEVVMVNISIGTNLLCMVAEISFTLEKNQKEELQWVCTSCVLTQKNLTHWPVEIYRCNSWPVNIWWSFSLLFYGHTLNYMYWAEEKVICDLVVCNNWIRGGMYWYSLMYTDGPTGNSQSQSRRTTTTPTYSWTNYHGTL